MCYEKLAGNDCSLDTEERKMTEPLISIIVPVYRVESYLSRCVDSLLAQTYQNLEIILVDDGSPDQCPQICEDYAKKEERIHVIHQENRGLSGARNAGIDVAKGEYLAFVDSDDYVSDDYIQVMYDAIKATGCAISQCRFTYTKGEKLKENRGTGAFRIYRGNSLMEKLYGNEEEATWFVVAWNKLYRRDIVEEHKLRMDTDISWCEDFMFNLEYVRYAETFYALRTPVYYYVKTKGSLVNQKISITKTVKMKLMMFEYYNNFYKHVLDEEDYEKNRLQVYHFLVDAAKDGFVFPASIPGNRKLGEERSSALQEVISDDGIIVDKYRDRKLLERYLESAALKHDMTMEELSLLLYLKDTSHELSRKNLADLMDLSRGDLAVAVQRLSAKKMVDVTELPRRRGTERKIRLELLPASEVVIPDLEAAENDYYQAKFGNFTEEEIRQYTLLARKVRENERSILQRG